MITRRSAVLATVFALAVGARASATENFAYDAVKAGVESGRVLLVDVREVDEFVAGHVPGAVNLPLSSFKPAMLPQPAGQTVVIMCKSGRRAGQALEAVEASGRHDAAIYSGSMNDWQAHQGAIATGK